MTRLIINITADDKLSIGENYHPKNESETEEVFEVEQLPEISKKYRAEGFDLVLSVKAKKLLVESDFPQILVRKINNKYYKYEDQNRIKPNFLEDSIEKGLVIEIPQSDVEQLIIGEPLVEEGVTSCSILNI
jgi:hypothetical protein